MTDEKEQVCNTAKIETTKTSSMSSDHILIHMDDKNISSKELMKEVRKQYDEIKGD